MAEQVGQGLCARDYCNGAVLVSEAKWCGTHVSIEFVDFDTFPVLYTTGYLLFRWQLITCLPPHSMTYACIIRTGRARSPVRYASTTTPP